MSWLDRFLRRKAVGRDDVLAEIAAMQRSITGYAGAPDKALQVSTVLGCSRVIAEGMAQPPFKLMQVTGKRWEPAREHSLYSILATQPNEWQTSFEFREMLALHAVLCGNFFAFINRSSRGQVLELLPIAPGRVRVERKEDWSITYHVRGEKGGELPYPAKAIWHVRGPSWNGYLGLEPFHLAREAIGLAMATEAQHSKLHKNGTQISGLMSVEGSLNDEKYQQMRKWLDKQFEGAEAKRAGGSMILDRGTKFTQMQMTGVDAQHLETRRYQVEEICRFLRVMPIMVGYSDKATTYASSEQMFLAHAVHTLGPWWTRIEQSADANLLTEEERAAGYYTDFVEEGLLRGAARDTKEVIVGYVNGGLMTPNEGRAKLDLNPDPDPKSDQLRIPANVVGEPQPETDPKPDPAKE